MDTNLPAQPIHAKRVSGIVLDVQGADIVGAGFRGVSVGRHVRYGARATATCLYTSDPGHQVPAHDCHCGFHTHADQDSVFELFAAFAPDAAALCDVDLHGRVLEHGVDDYVEGWRSERIRILGAEIPQLCSSCEDTFSARELTPAAFTTPTVTATVETPLMVLCGRCVTEEPVTTVALADLAALLGTELRWRSVADRVLSV